MTTARIQSDILLIGGGAAGLSLALRLADTHTIALISKGKLQESCTYYAQGGIAAVIDDEDSIESHLADTIAAGAGLCDENVVEYVVSRSKQNIDWLIGRGVPFTRQFPDKPDSPFHLTREGGHSHRRIIHAADATGRALETTLANQVLAHPNIRVYQEHNAIDLITTDKLGHQGENHCLGAYVLDRKANHVRMFKAHYTVLATGGASKVYLYTSNPDTATGDGIAMAWRAGCRVANLEFNQFHPTCLYHPQAKSFLITEALRGEGAILRLPDGTAFMRKFDERAELAPRDVVARAIDHEMKRLGSEYVLLDISHKSADFIRTYFPTVYTSCLKYGYDITQVPIPVVPAAHYTCGGIKTDLHGQTDVPGLYAIGEVAFTGLHGANRMASNSLLECLVFAEAASEHIKQAQDQHIYKIKIPDWDESRVTDSDEEVVVTHNWHELRRFMWDYVGIVRTNKRMQRALSRCNLLLHEIDEYYGNFRVSSDLLELRNLTVVANLIILSAMSRKESRGLHYTLDYPETNTTNPTVNTILTPEHHSRLSSLATVSPR